MATQCANCQGLFDAKYGGNIYCSRSCSASRNNRKHPKRIRVPFPRCERCDKELRNRYANSCIPCKQLTYIEHWMAGEISGGVGPSGQSLSKYIRRYLLEQAHMTCMRCGFNTPHPDDNKTILEINHINGDGMDHRPDNLEVICPNCHALTSSYRGRNLGHGRPIKYLRIRESQALPVGRSTPTT